MEYDDITLHYLRNSNEAGGSQDAYEAYVAEKWGELDCPGTVCSWEVGEHQAVHTVCVAGGEQ